MGCHPRWWEKTLMRRSLSWLDHRVPGFYQMVIGHLWGRCGGSRKCENTLWILVAEDREETPPNQKYFRESNTEWSHSWLQQWGLCQSPRASFARAKLSKIDSACSCCDRIEIMRIFLFEWQVLPGIIWLSGKCKKNQVIFTSSISREMRLNLYILPEEFLNSGSVSGC